MKRLFNLTVCAMAAFSMLVACNDSETTVDPEISAAPQTVNFPAEGGVKKVAVTVNVDDWSYSGQPEWIEVAADGKELVLTAEANPDLEERAGSMVLTAGKATFTLDLKQEKGSRYPGYEALDECSAAYIGSMYQMLMPDCEGGDATITLSSADGKVSLYIEFFTPEYLTADDVELPEGTYEAGDSFEDFVDFAYLGTPMTYVKGGMYVLSDDEGDEEFSGGASITYTVGDQSETKFITDGTYTVTANEDGTYTIKTDLKDADGNDLKYYYEGEILFDASDAIFPSSGDDIDPTDIVAADFTYNGENEAGTVTMNLMLSASSGAMTIIEYYVDPVAFDQLTDLSGIFSAPEGETDYSAGTMAKGSLIEMEGFSFPMGTYIMFQFGSYFVADGASMLMITKNEDGTYTIIANLQNTDEANEGYIMMAENIEVSLTDGTAYEEEE